MTVGENSVSLSQETNYPWSGDIKITVSPEATAVFGIKLRVPGWCKGAEVKVNGKATDVAANINKGYIKIEREWKAGDLIELILPMPVQRIYSHPDVKQDIGLIALKRGPIVYCLEQVDNDVPLHRIVMPGDSEFETEFHPDLLGGVVLIKANALCLEDRSWEHRLYGDTPPTTKQCKITAIPYYAWDNREPGAMEVWIREI